MTDLTDHISSPLNGLSQITLNIHAVSVSNNDHLCPGISLYHITPSTRFRVVRRPSTHPWQWMEGTSRVT